MFTRTQWRVSTWNDLDVQVALGIGVGGGLAEIGLTYTFDNSRYTLYGTGVSAGIGVGIDIMGVGLPLDGFMDGPDIHTAGGTLYKNDLLINGELTIDHFRDTFVLVRGFEFDFGTEEGACYYMFQVHSTGAVAGSVATGGFGIMGEAVNVLSCRAATFFCARSLGLPGAVLAGHRYRITRVLQG
ncbi:MAG: hypothetical protein ABFD82_17130 [Syntrophaceae bacterium]